MAKAGYIMGGARGKVGNYVFQKGEKGTVQRVRVKPANPKTLAQRKQRMSFAMATSAATALKFIVNHSFQNISGEKENIREFVRLNSKMIRAMVENFIAGIDGFHGNAQIKGARTAQAANYIISRGTAYFPTFAENQNNGLGVEYAAQGALTDLSATITTQAHYEAALAVLGVKPGDQLSLVSMYDYPTMIAQYDGEPNYLGKVYASRITFLSELPENFSGTLIVDGAINPALIEEKAGDVDMVFSTIAATADDPAKIVVALDEDMIPAEASAQAIGVIRSVKDLNGKFEYSPCQLKFVGEGNDCITVLGSYADKVSTTDSNYFLDQAVAVPFTAGE